MSRFEEGLAILTAPLLTAYYMRTPFGILTEVCFALILAMSKPDCCACCEEKLVCLLDINEMSPFIFLVSTDIAEVLLFDII